MSVTVIYSDVDQTLTSTVLTNVNAVIQSISNILTTPKGTRVFNSEFGSNIEDLLFELMDDITALQIYSEVVDAIGRWEPRATLVTNMCSVTPDYDRHIYWVVLAFKIKGFGEEIYSTELGLQQ